MIFWNKICGLTSFLLFSCLFSNAQKATAVKLYYNDLSIENKLKAADSTTHFMSPSSLFADHVNVNSPVSADFSTCTYGFFCKEELKIEKSTKIPVRFRLGSLQQCNYYEGKR